MSIELLINYFLLGPGILVVITEDSASTIVRITIIITIMKAFKCKTF